MMLCTYQHRLVNTLLLYTHIFSQLSHSLELGVQALYDIIYLYRKGTHLCMYIFLYVHVVFIFLMVCVCLCVRDYSCKYSMLYNMIHARPNTEYVHMVWDDEICMTKER